MPNFLLTLLLYINIHEVPIMYLGNLHSEAVQGYLRSAQDVFRRCLEVFKGYPKGIIMVYHYINNLQIHVH